MFVQSDYHIMLNKQLEKIASHRTVVLKFFNVKALKKQQTTKPLLRYIYWFFQSFFAFESAP